MDFEVARTEWPKYTAGQKVEVEALQYMMGDQWQKALIIKPIESVSNCYEVAYENSMRGIVHAYRLRMRAAG